MSDPSSDPRLTLARAGVADFALEGLVEAERFVASRPQQCIRPVAALRRAPDDGAEQMDQLLFGEAFDVLAVEDGWAFGQARRDGYVGYVRAARLGEPAAATHTVAALRTYGFAEPDIKSPIVGLYSMNALVAERGREGRFVEAAGGGWIVEAHLAPIGRYEADPAAVALRFLGAPYQWGGRESAGLDCSGLMQQALYACGRACPRDSDQQQALGAAVEAVDLARGDLVFWRGHVGMMIDAERLIHANAHHMAVVVEPLVEAVARIAAAGAGEPVAWRRLEAF